MTKQELLDEILAMPLDERLKVIANIVRCSFSSNEVLGHLMRGPEGDPVGLIFATGSNAEPVIELMATIMQKSAQISPEDFYEEFDIRKKP